MGRTPEFAIFRKFQSLNMLNLLRLQAEIQKLEEDLADIQEEDETSGDGERMQFAGDFLALRESEGTENSLQYEKLLRLGSVLQECTSRVTV